MKKQPKLQIIRQGDVALVPITTRRQRGATPVPLDKGRVVLAYGEVTGHAHVLDDPDAVQLEVLTDGTRELTVDRLSRLVHDEHDALEIPAGRYRVQQQREYTPEAIVNVAD